ncbi:MAG: phosphate ABC transporter permease subunit PstC [Pseudomonadota bacterium]
MFEIIFCFMTAFLSGAIIYGIVQKKRYKGQAFPCTSLQYGLFSGLLATLFSIAGLILYAALSSDFSPNNEDIAFFYAALLCGSVFCSALFTPLTYNVRLLNEGLFRFVIFIAASFAFFVTIGIILSLVTETFLFFEKYPFYDFVFGLEWSPQIALREDQQGASGKFGMIPLLTGTLLITSIALTVAIPLGLGSALYLCEFAHSATRRKIKPILEILAGIPTVVYGFFAAITVAPFIKNIGTDLGLYVSSESALAAGLVMGIMIVPYISSLSDDVIHAVPQALRDGSSALGATQMETALKIVLPTAFPGIVSAFVLGFSRAIGETMIVLMAAGLAGRMSFNPLESVTTFTVQIGTLLTGDQEFDSVKTLSAFALGSALFVTTLILNIFAVRMIRKYREKYA